jgi:hypothetical protein
MSRILSDLHTAVSDGNVSAKDRRRVAKQVLKLFGVGLTRAGRIYTPAPEDEGIDPAPEDEDLESPDISMDGTDDDDDGAGTNGDAATDDPDDAATDDPTTEEPDDPTAAGPDADVELTRDLRRHLERLERTEVDVHRSTKKLHQHLGFKLIKDLAPCVLRRGSRALMSPPQSYKNLAEAALAIVAKAVERPCLMLVGDVKTNIMSLIRKMRPVLRRFDVTPRFVDGRVIRALAADENARGARRGGDRGARKRRAAASTLTDEDMRDFRRGALFLVAQAGAAPVRALRRALHDVEGLCLVLDESDYMFTSALPASFLAGIPNAAFHGAASPVLARVRARVAAGVTPVPENSVTKREQELYGIVAQASRVVSVSATHMATLKWHSDLRLPYHVSIADPLRLQRKGCTLVSALEVFKGPNGRPVWLDPLSQTRKHKYNVNSPQVRAFLQAFRADASKGRMLMVALTTAIRAGEVNAQSVMKTCVERCTTAAGVAPVGIVVAEGGARLYVDGAWLNGGAPMDPQAALQYVDDTYGLERPVIVAGYGSLTRCVSLRSDRRVITHLLVAPTKGYPASDVAQMVARFCGFCKERRTENVGRDRVVCLMLEADYDLVSQLDGLTEQALTASGTGSVDTLDAWKTMAYSGVFHAALLTRRKHARGKLGVNEDMQPAVWLARRTLYTADHTGDDAVATDNDDDDVAVSRDLERRAEGTRDRKQRKRRAVEVLTDSAEGTRGRNQRPRRAAEVPTNSATQEAAVKAQLRGKESSGTGIVEALQKRGLLVSFTSVDDKPATVPKGAFVLCVRGKDCVRTEAIKRTNRVLRQKENITFRRVGERTGLWCLV